MRRIQSTSLVLLAGFVLGSGAARAQTIPSPYRFIERKQDIGFFVGYIRTDPGELDLGPKSGPIFGVQYALRLNDPLQLGAYAAVIPTERDVINPRGENGPEKIGVEDLRLLTLGGRIQFNITGARSWHNLMPYILAGIGITADLTGETEPPPEIFPSEVFEFNNSFTGLLGVGVAWFVSERIGARFTVHDNIWRFESPRGFFDPDLELDPAPRESEWVNNFQFSAGLSLWF